MCVYCCLLYTSIVITCYLPFTGALLHGRKFALPCVPHQIPRNYPNLVQNCPQLFSWLCVYPQILQSLNNNTFYTAITLSLIHIFLRSQFLHCGCDNTNWGQFRNLIDTKITKIHFGAGGQNTLNTTAENVLSMLVFLILFSTITIFNPFFR